MDTLLSAPPTFAPSDHNTVPTASSEYSPAQSEAAFGFESLIAPCSPKLFFAEHWRRKVLHVPNASATRFESVLRLGDIDSLFNASLASPDDWFFFRAEEFVGKDKFTSAQNQVLLNSIYALYRDGGTIHLRNTQRYLPSIERFWRAITQRFRAQVKMNLWVTRGNEFSPYLHFDTHDIFILQLHGSKHWTLYNHNPALFAPRTQQVQLDRRDVGEPAHKITVKAGDMLYVPAGTPHEVITLEPHSVHVAVGVFPILWRDVLDSVLADLDPRGNTLAEAVPPELLDFASSTGADGEALRAVFRGRLLQAIDEVSREALQANIQSRFIDAMPPPDDGHFLRELLKPNPAASVEADTLLKHRAGAPALVQVDARGDAAHIRFPGGGEMKAPAALAETLKAVADAPGAFSAQGLPPHFDIASRTLLLEELLQRGMLERVKAVAN